MVPESAGGPGLLSHQRLVVALLLVATGAHAQQDEPASYPPTLQDLQQRLLRVEQIAGSKGVLQLSLQFDQMRNEIRALRGSLEESAHRLERLQAKQEELYTDLDQRLRALEQAGVRVVGDGQLPPPPPVTDGTVVVELPTEKISPPPVFALQPTVLEPPQPPPPPAGLPVPVRPPSPLPRVANPDPVAGDGGPVQAKARYDQAFKLLKQSLYESAIDAFRAFLQEFPLSDHVGNARYWLAEAYYIKENYAMALDQYRMVAEQHPKSLKLAQAMLKLGYTQQALGDQHAARQALQEVINVFPQSPEAVLARQRINQLQTTP